VKPVVFLILLFAFSSGVYAETRYVTDQFKITMRSGASTGHKILRMLPSGSSVEVLKQDSGSGYTQVRASGELGYVLTRQLMKRPSARNQLAGMQARLSELQEAPGKLSGKLTALQREHEALQEAHTELREIKQQLERELEGIRRTAADAVRINNERNELRKNVASLTRERENLKQENRDLTNQSTQQWFLIGAGVIILGIIIGLILPHLRFQRRKSSWGSL